MLVYVALGFVVGFFASKQMGRKRQSYLVHTLLGIFGSVAAGWLYCCVSLAPGFNGLIVSSMAIAIIGAAGLLVLYEMLVHGDL